MKYEKIKIENPDKKIAEIWEKTREKNRLTTLMKMWNLLLDLFKFGIKWVYENPMFYYVQKRGYHNENNINFKENPKYKNVCIQKRRINIREKKEYLKNFLFMKLDECGSHFINNSFKKRAKNSVYLFVSQPENNDLYPRFQKNNHNADFLIKVPRRAITHMQITNAERKKVGSKTNKQNVNLLKNEKCEEKWHWDTIKENKKNI